MRLAKLTLSGFKSFADRTEFTFGDPVTGVVGPNGCGKSNIVDSIKWVLGERSSKSLRGKEMIDVIFAGSAGRKPAGLAGVALTFENPVIDASAEMVEIEIGEDEDGQSSDLEDHGEPPGGGPRANGPLPDGRGSGAAARRKRRALPIDADIVEVERRLY